MIAVYAADNAPPVDDVNRHLLNFIEIFELNGSGWLFSNFQSLQFHYGSSTLYEVVHSFHYLGQIQARRVGFNAAGTGDDCFKVGHTSWHASCRCAQGKYVEHIGKYDFFSFVLSVQAIGCFALRNNMSINVYGVDDDNKMIYPIHVSSTLMPDRHVDLLLFECDGVHHYHHH